MNMKKIIFLCCFFVLYAFTGCNSDKDDMEDDFQDEEMFLSPANLVPEFSKGYRNSRNQDTSFTDDNNAEVTRDCNGVVRFVDFNNTPITSRPSSPEQFASTYLGVDLKANFKMYRQQKDEIGYHEWYRQYYKDVEVEGKGFVLHYGKEDRIYLVNGSYLPVNDLDVKPSFSANTARKIFAKYLNLSVDYIGDEADLYIVEFPLSADSDQWAPRLVYKIGIAYVDGEPYLSDEGQCYIDAKTGRILYVWANYIN